MSSCGILSRTCMSFKLLYFFWFFRLDKFIARKLWEKLRLQYISIHISMPLVCCNSTDVWSVGDMRQAPLPLPLHVHTWAAKLQASCAERLFIASDQLTSSSYQRHCMLSFILMWCVSIIRGPIKEGRGGERRKKKRVLSICRVLRGGHGGSDQRPMPRCC